jgi:hypothetical protein
MYFTIEHNGEPTHLLAAANVANAHDNIREYFKHDYSIRPATSEESELLNKEFTACMSKGGRMSSGDQNGFFWPLNESGSQ